MYNRNFSRAAGALKHPQAVSNLLFQLWLETVARAPRAAALIDASSGRRWSRAALAAGAGEWAAAFGHKLGLGISLRRRVAFSVPNGAEWFHGFLGLLAAGAVPVPIDPGEPDEAQAAAARAAGCSHLWRGDRLVALGTPFPAPRISRAECLVKMTSASTGAPRGLPATSEQMVADGTQICRSMGIGGDDANLAAIPLGYSYGLGNLVIPLLVQGTRSICLSSTLPHAVAADCRRFRPTVFPAVPPLLAALAASAVPASALASLRLVISAGSPIEAVVAADFAHRFGRRIHSFYGTSETGGITFDRTGEATLAGRSVGTPLEGVRLEPGRTGRFTVVSAAVLGPGRFRPADRGRLGAGGELTLLGRTGRMVKVAGRRLNLAEIERALRQIPGVRGAFAHLVPGTTPVLAAAVASELSPAELRRLLGPRLAPWKVPTRLVLLAEIPLTVRGKTDARQLRQLLAAPRTATSISTFSAARQMSAPR